MEFSSGKQPKDKATNKQQSITITGASTLSKDEVERMVNEAEANADADKEKSEKIDLKNQSDSLCYQTKKQLEELDTKISSEDKSQIESLIAELEEALGKEDYEAMKNLNEKIKNAIMEAGQKVYSQAQENPSEDVIETDFSTEK
jgi:molecular chaperone DnaK